MHHYLHIVQTSVSVSTQTKYTSMNNTSLLACAHSHSDTCRCYGHEVMASIARVSNCEEDRTKEEHAVSEDLAQHGYPVTFILMPHLFFTKPTCRHLHYNTHIRAPKMPLHGSCSLYALGPPSTQQTLCANPYYAQGPTSPNKKGIYSLH